MIRMSDADVHTLLDRLEGAARLVVGDRQFVYVEGVVLVWTRVGTRDRWSWSPSSDTYILETAGELPWYWGREVLAWIARAARLDLVAHGLAMGARTL